MKGRSLLRLIIGRVLLIALLYTACLFIVVDAQIGSLSTSVRGNILTSRLWEVGSYLGKDAKGRLVLNMPQVRSTFFGQPGVDFVIRDQKGKVLFHSPENWLDYTPPDVPPANSIKEFEFRSPKGEEFVGQSGWINFDKVPYLVQVTQSRDAAEEFSDWLGRRFLYNVALLAVPFTGLLAFSIIWTIRRSLASVNAASHDAREITFAMPGRRLISTNLPDEIRPLVEAFNVVLERLEAGIMAQKEFTAHAAHELRTPLSVLQAHLASLEDEDLKTKLNTDVEAMSRLVEQLLAAARLEHSGNLKMERMDLVAAVRDACFALWPLMLKQSLKLEVSGADAPVWIEGHYDSICRALRNVLENSLHYAPAGSAIEVQVDGTRIRIRDHGPGVAAEDRERIFERFWRRDNRQGSGAGLGLYIVRTTMKLHGGTVHVESAGSEGALFILSFPETRSRTT